MQCVHDNYINCRLFYLTLLLILIEVVISNFSQFSGVWFAHSRYPGPERDGAIMLNYTVHIEDDPDSLEAKLSPRHERIQEQLQRMMKKQASRFPTSYLEDIPREEDLPEELKEEDAIVDWKYQMEIG